MNMVLKIIVSLGFYISYSMDNHLCNTLVSINLSYFGNNNNNKKKFCQQKNYPWKRHLHV